MWQRNRVSGPVAKLAKEKGLPSEMGVGFEATGTTVGRYRGHAPIYAPTQSELHQWLRDKHNIHVDVQPNMHFCWQVRLLDIHGPGQPDYKLDPLWLANDYSSYEEALEAGILHALQHLPSL